jgi:hypothetical protein
MRAEFEIGGEEKRPIGTCAVQTRSLNPSFKRGCFSVAASHGKALSHYLDWRSPEIGNYQVENRIY